MNEQNNTNTSTIPVPAHIALPESGTGPGVILMHAWWGLNEFFVEFADRLAREGFVVAAPDLYGGKTTSEIGEAKRLVSELEKDEEGYRQAIKQEEAVLDYLLGLPAVTRRRVGVIAFSMGAAYATWLAALRPEVAAVALFYGGSDEWCASHAVQSKAAFLGHFAEGDEWESDEGVQMLKAELEEAGHDTTIYIYPGVGHWFMENNRPDVFNPPAANLAWERTIAFLHDQLDDRR